MFANVYLPMSLNQDLLLCDSQHCNAKVTQVCQVLTYAHIHSLVLDTEFGERPTYVVGALVSQGL